MNIKTYINNLKQASMVVDNVKQATTTTAYANAIKGLNLEQAKLALSTKQLSSVEKEEILVKAGLLNATGQLTTGQLTAILTTKQRNAEDAKALLLSTELISAETAEATATNIIETAKLKELVATKQLTVAEAELIAMKAKVTTANIKEASTTITSVGKTSGAISILGQSIGSTLSKIGNGLLSFASAHPMITALTATVGLVGLVNSEIKKYQEEQEELIENAKVLQEEYRSFTKSTSDNINSLKGQEDEFECLSKGVSEFGENISLSADEYDRYKSIVAEVLGYTPELISGYDAEGTAIANKNSLLERSIELMKEEQRQKLKELTSDENTETAYDAAKAEWDKNKAYDGATTRNEIARWFDNNSTSSGFRYEGDIAKILGVYDEYKDEGYDLYLAIIDDIGTASKNIKEKKDELLALTDARGKSVFTREEIDNMVDLANEWQKSYNDWQESIEESKHGMDDQFNLFAQRADGYDDLNNAQKAFVDGYIKATGEIVDAEGNLLSKDDILDKAKDYEKFVDKLATDPDYDSVKKKIDELYSIDFSDISLTEVSEAISKYVDEIAKILEINPLELKIALGFEDEITLLNNYQSVIDSASRKAVGVEGANVMTADQYAKYTEIYDKIDEFAQEQSINTQDEIAAFNKALEDANYDIDKAFENYLAQKSKGNEITVLSFSDLFNADSIDDTKQKLLDLATSGELSAETITSTEEYKALLDQTAMSAQEFVDAIERFNIDNLNASFEKYNEVLQKVRNGQTLSAEEIASYIAENEELANAVIVTNGAYSLEEDALTSLINKYIETSNVAISNQIEASRRIVDSVKTRISAYNSEIVSLETLATLTKIWEVSGGSQTAIGQYLYNNFGGTNATSYVPEIIKIIEETKKLDELLKELDESLENGNKNSSDSTSNFDWIDIQISNVEDSLDNLNNKIDNTYSNWTERSNALKDVISDTEYAIGLQAQAYDKYMAKADSVNLPEYLKERVRLGDMSIQDNVNSDTKKLIDEYSEWYNKAREAEKAQAELNQTLAELKTSTTVDMIEEYYDAIDEAHENSISSLQNKIDKAETQGFFANESYYEGIQNELVKQRTDLEKKKADLDKVLLNSGLDKNSSSYTELQNLINSISNEIEQLGIEIEETKKSAQENEWNYFDYLRESVSRLIDEADYFIELLSNEKLFDDQGNLTKYADATMALHSSNYEVYMANAKAYADEVEALESELANGGQDVVDRYNEVVDAHQDAILAAQQERQAILDLVEEGYNAQLDALNEIIDKKKEALNAEKSLYDYQKSIQEKTDKVSLLQRQYDVYSNDTSEEGLAQAQKIKVELESAKADLEQTEYEKMISDQEQMLDALSLEYETWMNARLDDENALLTQIKDEVSQKSDEIQATLKEVAGQYGTTLSTSLTSIFGSEKPFDSVVTAIEKLIDKISGVVGVDGTSSNGSDGVSNGGFNGSTNEPTLQVKPTIASSDKETQGKSERYMFIDKKSVYPKELLKKTAETSIVDRLKLNDKDSSWDARAKYYADLGGKGTYTGSASQNKWLISKMKENGFAKGGTIGGLVKQTGEDGFILARTGEEIFSLEKIKALDGVFQRIEPFIANPNLIKLPDFVSRSASSSASVEVGSVQIVLPNVTNYDEFRNKLIRDNTFEKAVQEFTIGQALGRNSMNKYKY